MTVLVVVIYGFNLCYREENRDTHTLPAMAESERDGAENGSSISTPIPAAVSTDYPSSLTSTDSTESYRPIHSLLLCSAQWSALLESPISLVRGRGEDDVGQLQDGVGPLKDRTAEERLAVASSEAGGER